MGFIWGLVFFSIALVLTYQCASRKVWGVAVFSYLILLTGLGHLSLVLLSCYWVLFALFFIVLSTSKWRYQLISSPALKFYQSVMPSMSRTEREALTAGTVGWEGEIFKGKPNWNTFITYPKPQLSAEEQAFLEGPVNTLCSMIDDWDVTHHRADLPKEVWNYMKEQGFFSLIIPKEFGGKAFSAYAHSQVLLKLYSKSVTVATTVAVPNSLGPAELLLHYGTQPQKEYYLPRLARGEEIPCFALTGPDAGSDAGSMQDKGMVCWGEHEGKKILGIRLDWDKRYITLAPVATVIGLAFKLFDPDHLLGEKEQLGITCALIPRNTPGVTIGRRHYPINIVFQNGPTQGKDVFIPLDWIIGGPKMIGQGWRMLMECLAAGRAISLPSSSVGSGKMLVYNTGAYARVRRQFNVPIGHFEGIKEALARIAGYTYAVDALRSFTAAIIDMGAKPAVASAITKYHATELGRVIGNDAMDIHGGKGICLGPRNYVGRFYESIPIAITVEGANILTRSLIIFGQGAMRCHPYLFAEFEAAGLKNQDESLKAFDQALMGHMGFAVSNVARSFILGLTQGRLAYVPNSKTKYFYQQVSRFSAAFALIADVSLLVLGKALKRKESLSARLGDVFSYLYLISAVLKHYDNQSKSEDLPLVHWVCFTYLNHIQETLHEILKNFPNRFVSVILRALIFPLGKPYFKPSDKLTHKLAHLIMEPSSTRYRLAQGAFTLPVEGNVNAELEDALLKVIAAEPVEAILKAAIKSKTLTKADNLSDQAKMAFAQQIITKEQLDIILQAESARAKVIAVDDFDAEELTHTTSQSNTYAAKQSDYLQ